MSIPSFELRVVRDDGRIRIVPAGELDVATAPQLEEAVAVATDDKTATLVVDLRELTFMDSTGLRVLAQATMRAQSTGVALSIWRGSQQIERVLEISGLRAMLPLVDAPAD